MRLARALLLVVVTAGTLVTTGGPAAGVNDGQLPAGFTDAAFSTPGLRNVTALTIIPGGRFLVSEQSGRLRIVEPDGTTRPDPLLQVNAEFFGTQGLFGAAVHPSYPVTPWLYVYYTTRTSQLVNRLSRFTVAAGGNSVVPNSELVIFESETVRNASVNHLGGDIQFGRDGKLYVTTGDNLESTKSPSLESTFGKVLRFNPDGTIPTDNPFFSQTTGPRRAIWALGLRNPWKLAVDRQTGEMYVADVGATRWEEINDIRRGGDYQWPGVEGPPPAGTPGTGPVFAYQQAAGDPQGNTVVGGAFYRPVTPMFPAAYAGDYFFADFGRGWIGVLDDAGGGFRIFHQRAGVVDLDVGPDGALYYLTRAGNAVRRVSFAVGGPTAPVITDPPADVTAIEGEPATFTVVATGTPPLSYQWQRNGVNVPGQRGPSLTLPAATRADNGVRFRVVVSNSVGSVTSLPATLRVVTGSRPTARITAPAVHTTYGGGQQIAYAGSGVDADDGLLGAPALRWEVVFHHDEHTHPFIPPFVGSAGGRFTIPTAGETATHVWYRVHLTVTDSTGLTATTFVDIHPRLINVVLATQPAGLELRLDGQPVRGPHHFPTVEGIERTIGAPPAQRAQGGIWSLAAWSDGGRPEHVIAPKRDTMLVGTFRRSTGYWLAEVDGDVASFGDAPRLPGFRDDLEGARAVAIAAHPSGAGFWVLTSDGRVLARGSAPPMGAVNLSALSKTGEAVASLSATPDGRGVWVFTTAGRVLALGTAPPPSTLAGADVILGLDLDGPVVDSVATPSGRGAYMVAADGGVFAIGDARFAGSVRSELKGGLPHHPVVGITPDPDGGGYWLVAADGGVFAIGAPFRGSLPAILRFEQLFAPVNGMVPYGNGYLLVAGDGGVFTFSDLPFQGSSSGVVDSPVIGIAAIGQVAPPPGLG